LLSSSTYLLFSNTKLTAILYVKTEISPKLE